MAFTCSVCGMTSYHPKDEEESYCGNCREWVLPKRTISDEDLDEVSKYARLTECMTVYHGHDVPTVEINLTDRAPEGIKKLMLEQESFVDCRIVWKRRGLYVDFYDHRLEVGGTFNTAHEAGALFAHACHMAYFGYRRRLYDMVFAFIYAREQLRRARERSLKWLLS